MDKLKGLRAGVTEMRSVAQRLMTWADDLEKSLQEKPEEEKAAEPAEKVSPSATAEDGGPSRPEVKKFLTELCAAGYAAQVKALIASFGAVSLSAVPDTALHDLLVAAQLIGEGVEHGV